MGSKLLGLGSLKEDIQNYAVLQAAMKQRGEKEQPLQDFSIKRRARYIHTQMHSTAFCSRINNWIDLVDKEDIF